MNGKMSVKKIVILLAAVSSLVSGSVFMILYARQFAEKQADEAEPSAYPSVVLLPRNMGSYGELMFAYIGEGNYLYNLDDESEPLIREPASILLYASDDTVIYTASTEISTEHAGRESIIRELQIGENENLLATIAEVTIDPCWSSNDEVVYYVLDGARNRLCTFEPLTSTSEAAAEFEEDVVGLRISSDGLLVTLESGAELLYVPLSKQLVTPYCDCQGSRIIVCEQYDLILSPGGTLSYRWLGANDAVKIADNVVVTQGLQDNEVLFIQSSSRGLSLMAYFVSEERTEELARLPSNLLPQLTVSPDYAFVIDDNFIVYRYTIDTREFTAFDIIPERVLNPMISVFDYRLMVYDLAAENDAMFVQATDAARPPAEEKLAELRAAAEASGKKAKYPEYAALQMASIGSGVQMLQEKLAALGYLSSPPTGIFDVATMQAVAYLQADLGMEQTGIADAELQHYLFSLELSAKPAYPALSVSGGGLYTRDVQARLRSLGYLKNTLSGRMDEQTIRALALFAGQNGLDYDGGIVRSALQEVLFSDQAARYHGYLVLQAGDCCEAVTALNRRLKELGYLTGSVNPVYDEKTARAVELFSEFNRLEAEAVCGVEAQRLLFSDDALPCPRELAPDAYQDALSQTKGQVISDRQLKILRKWLTKQFAINHTERQAVKRLQKQLVKLGYLNDGEVSMVYDSQTMEAVSAFQAANKIEANGIASKSTLTKIFNTTITSAFADE